MITYRSDIPHSSDTREISKYNETVSDFIMACDFLSMKVFCVFIELFIGIAGFMLIMKGF